MRMHEKFKYKSKEELLARAAALGLELPFSNDIKPLFTPSVLGEFKIENRLVVQPMEGYDSLADGSPSDLTRRRYLRYAAGGSGIIWFEAVSVSADGRSNPGQLWINNASVPAFSLLNRQIRDGASGIAKKPLLVIQLTHSGRYSKPERVSKPMVAAANSILDRTDPHILSDEELKRIQDDYVVAAKLSADAGFDAIDIKACHGYLMIELLGTRNRKDSEYGGEPLENRFRFMLETIDRIKDKVPGMLITTRLNLSDVYEGGFGVGSGKDPDFSDTFVLVGKLLDRGIMLVNASMGSPYHNPHVTRPYDTPLPGQQPPAEHPLEGVMRMIKATALFQEKFRDIQFVGSAYSWLRQYAPNTGAAVLNRKWASYIGFGRSSFAYPDLPVDLMKNGKADPAKVCLTCSGCTRLIRNFRPGGCVIRDSEIYGTELKKLIADGK